MKKFELMDYPHGKWAVIMTAETGTRITVESMYADDLDEALTWIRERT